ncbi:MAG: hypothetical protein H5T49_04340 [Hadesarchaea archaeon]|nr:hypothetical protein [Hadesarchaea archaeon]
MLIWIVPGWAEYHGVTAKELSWFAEKIGTRYRELLEKIAKVVGNPDACETVRLGKGPFGMEYVVEITEVDPDNVDFMQAIGAAPRMGVAIDIFAVRSSAPERIYELAGHVYEDGSEKVKFV